MKQLVVFLMFFACFGTSKTNSEHEDIKAGWKKMDGILERIQAPVFPDRQFDITDFGAKDNGKLCTKAFRKAIEACNEAGGGRVLVPEGTYVSGAIHLLSNVELHVEEGAIILFSTNPKDYLPVVHTRFEGSELYNYSPLIYAYKQENIAITGKGILDGQAANDNWWGWARRSREDIEKGLPSQTDPESVPRLLDLMGRGVPTSQRIFGEGHYLRPSFVQPYLCKNILIEGVTIKNPPMWMLHPVLSENITIRGVNLFSQGAPNGDGCDPEACKDILIEECQFNNGDDCIAIKSGRNRQGYDLGIPTENVIIRNCKMLDGHGGVVMGSETSGGVRNVYVYNCEMSSPNLGRALRLKSNKYRGGVIENIYLRDIKVGEVNNAAIRINQNYFSKAAPGPVKYTTYRNIFVENLTCEKADYAVQILGLEEHPIENVKIINCRFNNIKNENVTESVKGLVLENVEINGEKFSNQVKADQPNIIFILVDDLGYGDIGCFGQKKIQTPNIDRLAGEGIRFTQAYAGSAVCAPCRSTLMQGLHTGHARVRGNGYKNYREALRKDDYTVAMMLQEAGYKTGLFGKWGLALHNQYGIPNKMGFDEFFGYLNQRHAHCHYPEFLYHNEDRVYFPENGTHHMIENYSGEQPYDENGVCHPLGIEDPSKAKYAFDLYCEKSLEFVKDNKENPFFLYLAYTPPHGSYIAPELGVYTDKDWSLSHKVYASMITRVDNEIGKLMQLLNDLDLDENTLVLFASDNGNTGGNAKEGEIPTNIFFKDDSPRAGMKGDIRDGAFHVPAFARWTNRISPGQESDHIWAMWDFLPTVADLLGQTPPEDIDGISILPTLMGESEKQKKHDFLYWEYQEEQAVRMANWYGYKNKKGKLEIYDLEKNPAQDRDLSAQHPDVARKIDEIMIREHTPSDVWPSPGETEEAFKQRMARLGITAKERPLNVADF